MNSLSFRPSVRACVAAWLCVLAARSGHAADATPGGLPFAWTPRSVAERGSGGLYGSYDVFKAFRNPALSAWQPSAFEVGAAAETGFGGDQQLWAVAGSWAEDYAAGGCFGVAALASGARSAAFDELDLYGRPTGVQVAPSAYHLAAAAFYQYAAVSAGGALHFGGSSYGSGLSDGIETGLSLLGADLGAMVRLGRADLGVRFGPRDRERTGYGGEISFGGAIRTSGRFPGAVNLQITGSLGRTEDSDVAEAMQTVENSFGPRVEGGVTWNAARFLTLRAGAGTPGGGATFRVGLTVPWRQFAFDYAAELATGSISALGSSHVAGLRWTPGGERKQWVKRAPKEVRFESAEKERTLAVANLDPQNVSASDAAIIADLLRNELVREGTFNIVEKANMERVLQEQAFQQTGCTTQECAVKLGKILNVRFLVVGGFGRILDQFVVSMRVVDIESGRIIYSDTTQGRDLAEVQAGVRSLAMRLTDAVRKE